MVIGDVTTETRNFGVVMELYDEVGTLMGLPVEVTEEMLDACRVNDQFGALVFELYKEAGSLVCVSSAVHFGDTADAIKLNRNQAICAGLLVRIAKYMVSEVKLSADIEHGETVQALNRCIIESAVDLRYLLLKDDDEIYGRFVKNGLAAERELYDTIQGNIKARAGKQLAIEQSMLNSIKDTCEQSGLTVEEINKNAGRWGGNFRNKLSILGYDCLVLSQPPNNNYPNRLAEGRSKAIGPTLRFRTLPIPRLTEY